ncbi:MAG: RHS repeat-associated core domain-containing protein [Saprospiraceae bacterium]|nr:RHS repeat-associated core domain-containing protein [Saprospiraceae bacterium]
MAEQKLGGYSSRYRFTGKELDPLSGLYDFGARYYDPRLSVWFGVDPLAEKYPNWSVYNYVMNNPIIFTDPDGRDVIIEGEGGEKFNWTRGSEYNGKDKFISSSVMALNKLSDNENTANFNFTEKTGKKFKGNAVLDYAKGGKKENQDIKIKDAKFNTKDPGKNGTIGNQVFWDPTLGIREEGVNGKKGGGEFPSMGTLLHEMGHAALSNEYGGQGNSDRMDFFIWEEQMIIDHLEKPAMQSLGFGYRTAHNTKDNYNIFLKSNPGMRELRKPFVASYFIPCISPISVR